jgi:hypothetical protein
MFPSRTTALALAAFLALPGTALAAPRHHVHSSVTVPQPTIVVPHKYDAGGDGGELTTPTGMKIQLFDPVSLAVGLGNQALAQLGLPPVTLPTL